MTLKGSRKPEPTKTESRNPSGLYAEMLGYYRDNSGQTANRANYKKTIKMAQKLLRGRRTASYHR